MMRRPTRAIDLSRAVQRENPTNDAEWAILPETHAKPMQNRPLLSQLPVEELCGCFLRAWVHPPTQGDPCTHN